jgi:hypothetical protein
MPDAPDRRNDIASEMRQTMPAGITVCDSVDTWRIDGGAWTAADDLAERTRNAASDGTRVVFHLPKP